MGAALGCGGPVDEQRINATGKILLPMWNTLPKNSQGRIDQRSLRYIAHRYFMQQSSLQIRGFEPSRVVNSTHQGHAEILSQRVPAYVEMMLEGPLAERGFSLEDAVAMVMTLEQLIYDSEANLLQQVLQRFAFSRQPEFDDHQLAMVLDAYMVSWMIGDDKETIDILLRNRSLLEDSFPHWNMLSSFARGRVTLMNYERRKQPKAGSGAATLNRRFSFHDTHQMVADITHNFGSFWESECVSMKSQLVDMDPDGDGRVPLSKFYGSALESEWRFGESEAYLRDLGVLDESSMWKGKQVIIPNYIQAASNCIVSTPHYLVCCANECEGILGEVEAMIGQPAATPEQILSAVANVTVETSDLTERPPLNLQGALKKQLEQIAAAHGGQVPLHGRLFSQWLHYVYPQECPFPHKQGVASMATPNEFGGEYIASHDEMHKHAVDTVANRHVDEAKLSALEQDAMSMWEHEEELFADYTGHLRAPWESKPHRWVIPILLMGLGVGVAFATGSLDLAKANLGKKQNDLLPTYGGYTARAHLV
eukprot:gnl/TRDRNA2_/TRDRNA2_165589_c3_seq3.p1 gnl/TRDRNA2_/TRDRNA2_165589_c3~~gnl/TRDRNA2_/TRDRNA2_165589_c3_seq3.p1  ORF type:complete len:599 (-),score=117.32 gnl/TRDRNA2_/TRDRNA2_165589_c3_seq3:87-1697(-)